VFVVELAGLQAVVQLAEELVEQMPLGLVVPVSCGAAGIEVAAGAGRGAQRSQGPDRADGGEAPVFDMAVPGQYLRKCSSMSEQRSPARSSGSCSRRSMRKTTRFAMYRRGG
jgi:hypothetical protein